MIAFLNGTLVEKTPAGVLLEVGGVGYELGIPLSTFQALPPVGRPCRLLVHEHLREDAHLLFGFATEAERKLFRLLQNVSGIGVKTALGALSGMDPRELKRAILARDIRQLSRIAGIGKKTAERIVVELVDKIDPLEALAEDGTPSAMTAAMRDAVLALCALGHPQDVALARVRKAAAGAAAPPDTETLIRQALSA